MPAVLRQLLTQLGKGDTLALMALLLAPLFRQLELAPHSVIAADLLMT
jgi:hypothetical protein